MVVKGLQIADVFALWVALIAASALLRPELYTWIDHHALKGLLAALVFFMGMTAKPTEFASCFSNPRPICVNAVLCLFVVPLCTPVLASAANLSPPLRCGLTLLASVNGGSSSNLFAMLAGADVALSIVMTASTTLCAVISIPLVAKALIGAVVPVDVIGILQSAGQLVLIPVTLGVSASAALPRTSASIERLLPAFGLVAIVPITGSVVAGSAEAILSGGLPLHLTVSVMHTISAAVGYSLSSALGGSECECRTVAIEVAMKNAVFASVLAASHFEDPAIKAPAAVSCIWCPIVAATMSAYWKARPLAAANKLKSSEEKWTPPDATCGA
mmetsp:Transcript_24006/g.55413  ORF Transcript_24006/g.55413 Transcript_24006/m.55413 type:complete len:330 (+) Transcript_24006:38-1027(+)